MSFCTNSKRVHFCSEFDRTECYMNDPYHMIENTKFFIGNSVDLLIESVKVKLFMLLT